jgi:transposase
LEKKRRDQLKEKAKIEPEWMLVDEDECWFSRFAQPSVYGWAGPGEKLRMVERDAKGQEKNKAIACYGGLRQDNGQKLLWLCDDRPNSDYTISMLRKLLEIARTECKKVLVVIWDRASWHRSKRLRDWVSGYKVRAKRQGDVRLIIYRLPKKSPWLNRMEGCWVHAKRKVAEPDGELTVDELKRRMCAHFGVEPSTATLKLSDTFLH